MENVLSDVYSRLHEAEMEAEATRLRFSSAEVLNAIWEEMRRE